MSTLKIGLAQIAPVWLNKSATLEKILVCIKEAGEKETDLIVFGETLLPGYPYWLSLTHGAEFNSQMQKEIHAHYLRQAIQIEAGDLNSIRAAAKKYKMAVYLGVAERPEDRGGHSIYASLVYIDKTGEIQSVHRKLQPTYEERLSWSPGDAQGLKAHKLGSFTTGGLNCWENWMPLPRTALAAMGVDLHIAVWPGAKRNTIDISRFIAMECRSFVVSVSGLMRKSDFPKDSPYYEEMIAHAPDTISDGGSAIAGPDGKWIIEPICNEEGVFYAEIDHNRVLEERHNFDPVGHYSRADALSIQINRERQSILKDKE